MTRSADEVFPHVWVGDIGTARTCEEFGIDTVVTVCQDSIAEHCPDDVTYYHFPLADGGSVANRYGGSYTYSDFVSAVTTVYGLFETGDGPHAGQTALVHCHNGVSRSVAVTCAAAADHYGLTYGEALGYVRQSRPQVDPGDVMASHARRYVRQEVPAGRNVVSGASPHPLRQEMHLLPDQTPDDPPGPLGSGDGGDADDG